MMEINFDNQESQNLTATENNTELEIERPDQHKENDIEDIDKIHVVVIEDHELSRIGIRTALLQHQKIEIVGDAANATDGLKLLNNLQPDIAIIDMVYQIKMVSNLRGK